ncbi:response regulator transcription factor [Vagococcus silagei]|uniref:Response regulator transcription factor n=1 Tax=Vagococcus silagei TaxID=2508885 RepID=A0A4V3TVA7_9ENTE|nr:response regulator transcription factor [Vagococcus silagei]THB62119.1 response regulator transcription factor [Vagococcus silagei]
MKLYLVEDDKKLNHILTNFLTKNEYDVHSPQDFSKIKEDFQHVDPDLVLMDITLPYFDGYYWTTVIRQVSDCPIIFMSARESAMDQIMALEYGGDDYITKPFSYDLLLAKIRSHIRRNYGQYADRHKERVITFGEFRYYPEKLQINYQEKVEAISQKEGELINIFLTKATRIVSRNELLAALWDNENFVDDNTLSVNITRLRKRLSNIGLPHAIQTIRGKGYKLILETSETR